MVSHVLERQALLGHTFARLAAYRPLTELERAEIDSLADEPVLHRRGHDLSARLEAGPHLVLAGWAMQIWPEASGARPVFGFLIPGDLVGSFWPRSSRQRHQVIALTGLMTLTALALVATELDGRHRHQGIVEAGRLAEHESRKLLIDHIVRLSAHDAYHGAAHLLLELYGRLMRVGLVEDGLFSLPVGQRVLARVLGISVVHLNHTLKRLTLDGLIEARGTTMRLVQPDRMASITGFDPHETGLR